MHEEIEKTIDTLRDRDAGWVTRRDAVELLGGAALKSVAALREFAEDADRDVQASVTKELGRAKHALSDIEAVAGYGLSELVESVASAGRREVRPKGDGFEIEVSLRDDRKQRIMAEPAKSQAGRDTIRLITHCGEATEKRFKWALRNNRDLSYCALALDDSAEGAPQFIMVASFLAGEVTPGEFKSTVKELAFYGDWVENKLTGGDEF